MSLSRWLVGSLLLPAEVATFSLLLRVFSSLLAQYSGTGTDIFRACAKVVFFYFFVLFCGISVVAFKERFVAASSADGIEECISVCAGLVAI